jgi:hypothetical protein
LSSPRTICRRRCDEISSAVFGARIEVPMGSLDPGVSAIRSRLVATRKSYRAIGEII